MWLDASKNLGRRQRGWVWPCLVRSSRAHSPFVGERRTNVAKDPVCGMDVDERTARATSTYQGKTYCFCSPGCKETFDENPEKFAGK